MPHLQFEINKKVSHESKEEFVKEIRATFSEIMDTGTDQLYDKFENIIKFEKHKNFSRMVA